MAFSWRPGHAAKPRHRPRETARGDGDVNATMRRALLTVPTVRRYGSGGARKTQRTAVPKLYFEDFSVGQVAEYGPRRVSREEIIAFAAQFDPQPMHLDEEAARHTMLGGLGASGWHTCSIMMRLIADGFLADAASMGSPGVDEVQWLKPVRPGDALTVRGTVQSVRASQSRSDRGFVALLWEVFNDRGERVMTMTCPQMMLRRHRVERI
jgi:acyl dehydratase